MQRQRSQTPEPEFRGCSNLSENDSDDNLTPRMLKIIPSTLRRYR